MESLDFDNLKKHVLAKLERELPVALTYHNVDHTLEVLASCERAIRRLELNAYQAVLVRTAALLHDVGYIWVHTEHEARGKVFAEEILPQYGYEANEIEIIAKMIMSTKVPQEAETILEKILCDADLMYLGTDLFVSRGNDLYTEFLAKGIVSDKDDWNRLQVKFLRAHRFHTDYAKIHYGPTKQKNLEELLERYPD